MYEYNDQVKLLVAIDCIIFGFDGEKLKILLIQRGMIPEKGKWSLMGGFLAPEDSLEDSAAAILKKLTGLSGVYLQQLGAFGAIHRDPVERTVSVAYYALIDIQKYEKQITEDFHAEWFLMDQIPTLIFDHAEMVIRARSQLRYKAALHPVLFELLPDKFTIPQLQNLYEGVYDSSFDNRNFSRKVLSTGLLIKMSEKDKLNSKKGAYYYRLNMKSYRENFEAFLHFIPNPEKLIQDQSSGLV